VARCSCQSNWYAPSSHRDVIVIYRYGWHSYPCDHLATLSLSLSLARSLIGTCVPNSILHAPVLYTQFQTFQLPVVYPTHAVYGTSPCSNVAVTVSHSLTHSSFEEPTPYEAAPNLVSQRLIDIMKKGTTAQLAPGRMCV